MSRMAVIRQSFGSYRNADVVEARSPWFDIDYDDRQADIRLFCFPYAGGSAQIFESWKPYLKSQVAICAVQLPGRGRRFNEPCFRHLASMIDALADAITPELHKPFIFFGYSMGALISFELARELRRRGCIEPLQLIVAGRRAPQLPRHMPPIHAAPDSEFVEEIRRLNGMPQELLNSAETMRFLVPLLRSDFELIETHEHREENPLSCPITAYGGVQDTRVPMEDLYAWKTQTTGKFSLTMFSGDHFFAQKPTRAIMDAIRRDIASVRK